MTREEKAYMAGLIDGEGTITLARHHRDQYPQPRLAIANNSRKLLEWAQSKARCGIIIRRARRKAWHHESYVWQVQLAGAVLKLLAEVEPYLLLKRRQARLLLADYKACTPRNGKYTLAQLRDKKELINQIRQLNEESRSRPPITRQAPGKRSWDEDIVHAIQKRMGKCPATSTISQRGINGPRNQPCAAAV